MKRILLHALRAAPVALAAFPVLLWIRAGMDAGYKLPGRSHQSQLAAGARHRRCVQLVPDGVCCRAVADGGPFGERGRCSLLGGPSLGFAAWLGCGAPPTTTSGAATIDETRNTTAQSIPLDGPTGLVDASRPGCARSFAGCPESARGRRKAYRPETRRRGD